MSSIKAVGIIPARFGSSRFPGKPLVSIGGKTMIQRVYEQCLKANSLQKVVVATDDPRIADTVKSFNGNVVLTSSNHPSGTDRCQEAFSLLEEEYDVVVNIQGDEPFIQPELINMAVACFHAPNVQIATLIKRIEKADELFDPNRVKVTKNQHNQAICFSRNPIPFAKDLPKEAWLHNFIYYLHIGLYAYRSHILSEITQLPTSMLEKAESLEQLRWLEYGYHIKLAETTMQSEAIDTPEDLKNLLDKLNNGDYIY